MTTAATIEANPNAPTETILRRNLDALACRGIHFRALETPAPTPDPNHLREAIRATIASIARPATAAADAMKPIVIEGINPPWALLEAWRVTTPTPDGYSPRLLVVQQDESELLAGLALADLTEIFADPRVEFFFGPNAGDRIARWLAQPQQQDAALPAHLVRSPSLRTPVSPPIETLLHQAHDTQQRRHQSLQARVAARDTARDRVHWVRRFAGPGPLRILLPISRFSTFVRHSAEDLAAALRRIGHEAVILSEPDPHSKLTTPAYLGAFDRFDPDLVVLINYTRRHMAHAVPPGVPFVCWIQDRMQHLFDPAVGDAQTDRDFVMGHLHPDLFSHARFPATNRLFAVVPACAARFNSAPLPESQRRRLACDVAYISHQSETPEQFHARLAPWFASHAAIARSLSPLFAAATRWLDHAVRDPRAPTPDRRGLINAALKDAGLPEPDERLVNTIFGGYLVPLMERMVRHRALEAAARICRLRGWNLRLYGRGWDSHPRLAEFAAGPLDHDDDSLRAVYQSASTCLHASLNSNGHQRVFECALSGGLMLRKGPCPDWELAKIGMMRLAAQSEPVGINDQGVPIHECVAATPEDPAGPARYDALRGFAPTLDSHGRRVFRKPLTPTIRRELIEIWPEIPLAMLPDLIFPRADETLFHDETELESMIARSINDPEWRRETIEAHAAAVRASCTYDHLAAAMLRWVADSLNAEHAR